MSTVLGEELLMRVKAANRCFDIGVSLIVVNLGR